MRRVQYFILVYSFVYPHLYSIIPFVISSFILVISFVWSTPYRYHPVIESSEEATLESIIERLKSKIVNGYSSIKQAFLVFDEVTTMGCYWGVWLNALCLTCGIFNVVCKQCKEVHVILMNIELYSNVIFHSQGQAVGKVNQCFCLKLCTPSEQQFQSITFPYILTEV